METAPQQARALIDQAFRLYQRNDFAGARALCEQSLAADRTNPDADHLLALTWLSSGDLERGVTGLEQLLARHPDLAPARISLGEALAHAGRHRKAEPQLRKAWSQHPNQPETLFAFGRFLASHGDPKEGIALLERLPETGPNAATVQYHLADARRRLGHAEAALSHLQRASQLRPGFFLAWRSMGDLLIDLGRATEAGEAYRQAFRIHRQPGGPEIDPNSYLLTNHSKLRHDIEQFKHLMARGVLPEAARRDVAGYEAALAALPDPVDGNTSFRLSQSLKSTLAPTYNRMVHWHQAAALPGGALHPGLDSAATEGDYLANAPGHTVVDGLLKPEALESLRRFCLESTIWYSCRYANGYLGAFMDDGFSCPLLFQIADDLRMHFPRIFKDHQLTKLWAFKYDSRLSGIPTHADFAAINVNFWITPDDANLEPDSGGLVFWDQQAPRDWDFASYNSDDAKIEGFLRDSKAKEISVPHRQNRAVIFNSDLFHRTGDIHFRDGYENRRVNVTMLFGQRDRT